MTRKAIGRILFTFSCVIAMVLVFGQQASNNHAYAAPKNDPRDVTYVEQNITWTGFKKRLMRMQRAWGANPSARRKT